MLIVLTLRLKADKYLLFVICALLCHPICKILRALEAALHHYTTAGRLATVYRLPGYKVFTIRVLWRRQFVFSVLSLKLLIHLIAGIACLVCRETGEMQ